MGLFSKKLKCELCGKKKKYVPTKAMISFATPDDLRNMILQCDDCGKFMCYSCSIIKNMGLHCPSCNGAVLQPLAK